MLEEILTYLISIITKENVIYVAIAIISLILATVITYVVRIKDHMREENRIDDVHFRKVKDYIKDLCDGIEDQVLSKASSVFDTFLKSEEIILRNEIDTESCSGTCIKLHNERINTLREKINTQEERWDSDCRRGIDSKLYSKSCGWMRENGFYDWDIKNPVDVVKLEDYVNNRAKQSINSIIPYLKDKSRLRSPALTDGISGFITHDILYSFLMDITKYTILEMNESYIEIKKYRISHGFMPSVFRKILSQIKIGSKQ